ncbi:MAG TPA: histidine phosphatase family protein [Candidatus Eisenbacteria bacterium]|nr:histidine phosphatase family protein [Candidatus Eisenbacteria bacterium]
MVLFVGTPAIAPAQAWADILPDSLATPPPAIPVDSTAAPVASDTTMATPMAPSPTRMTPADEVNLPPLLPAPDAALAAALRKGGYIIVFRHAITDWSQRDSDGENFDNRRAQRNLSEAGRTQSTEIGKAIAAAGIPIGDVQASPMFRCRDTAELAFGHHTANPDLVRRGPKPREARVRMLGTVPKKGTNTVLVTHQDQLMPLVTGLRREQLREGEALIVKPLGEGKYEVLAQVGLEQWRALASHKP